MDDKSIGNSIYTGSYQGKDVRIDPLELDNLNVILELQTLVETG